MTEELLPPLHKGTLPTRYLYEFRPSHRVNCLRFVFRHDTKEWFVSVWSDGKWGVEQAASVSPDQLMIKRMNIFDNYSDARAAAMRFASQQIASHQEVIAQIQKRYQYLVDTPYAPITPSEG